MKDELRDPIAGERLAELRGAMAEFEAPGHVKPVVLGAFRSAQSRRRFHPLRWVSAAAAVIAVAAVLYWVSRRPAETAHSTIETKPPEIVTAAGPTPAPVQAVATAAKPAPQATRKVARRKTPPAQAPRQEVATDFIALPYAPPIDVNEDAQVIRVRLPRAAMRSVGLPVNEDRWFERVPAEVLLGQDGVARAVRFVKVAQ
jgi:hypothetical protein